MMARTGRPRTLTTELGDKLAPELLVWARKHSSMIMAGWLSRHHLDRKTCIDLQNRSDNFRSAYKEAMGLLEENLFRAATNAKGNQAIYILALKNAHQWRDKQEIEHSGSIGNAADIIRKAHVRPGSPESGATSGQQ